MEQFKHLMITAVLFAAVLISGCKKDDGPVAAAPDTELHDISIRFYPKFGAADLQFNKKYLNAANDSVQFITAKFYISEIALIDSTGALVPMEGLALVNFASLTNGYTEVKTKGPDGTYRGIRFSVGIPVSENHKDAAAQSLPLGPNSGMYWGWNPGYIFHMIEGKVDSAAVQRDFFFHIGEDNRKASIMLATISGTGKTSFTVEHTNTNIFSVSADYAKLFSLGLDGVNPLKLSQNVSERSHHVTPAQLANRTFANTSTMFTRIP
ncbi:MAG: MbnP family protein [Bacteroidota bacterium]